MIMNLHLRTRALLAALVACVAAAHPAAAQTPGALELAGQLFERTGLGAQLEPLAAQFQEGVQQNRGKLPDELLAALAEAGRLSYAVPALRTEIVPLIARKLNAADTKQVLAWLDAPLGRRVTMAETESGAMSDDKLQAWLEGEKGKPASPRRERLIADLLTAGNAIEIGANFIEAMSLGIAVGMDAAQPAEKRLGIAVLRERLRAYMPPDKLRANLSATMPVMYGYTYRAISDPDLAAYLKFNQSPLGTRYNKALADAVAEALTHASVRVGELVQSGPGKKQI
jgi:uncharacterized protein DUF2059